MNATVLVVCYKSKTLSNGEHPLMLRITKNRKTSYKSLKVSVNAKYWDFEKNEPKSNCPNKDLINKIILQTKLEYQQKILEKRANEEEFTATSLINEQKDVVKCMTVDEFYHQTINELRNNGQVGTSYAYKNSYDTLKNFNNGNKLNYTFSYIDVEFCHKFEEWMRRKENKDTTISYQFRTLRAAYNRAVLRKIVNRDKSPFNEFTLSHLNTRTAKRALTKSDILKIMNFDCSGKTELAELAHDVFCFSYLCGGISFVDIAHLTSQNIADGRLIYDRQKTHGCINIMLNEKAYQIIEKYKEYEHKAGYLFPILHSRRHTTPMQRHNRVRKVCAQVNKELKFLAKILNINSSVTTYVARHSFATVLKKSGVNINVISQALGHQDIKTTQIYLSKFDNEQIDAAMKHLL